MYQVTTVFESIDHMSNVINKITGNMEGKFGAALAVVTTGLTMAGAAAADFASKGVGMASEFQDQIAILEVASRSFGVSMEQLHDVSLQVGADTSLVGVSATGAADAITGLVKAGMSANEIFGDLQGYMAGTAELGGALRASIDLAAATELDMVQASDLAAVALATFGAELETEAERAEFVNEAMNNMVQAADASVAEVSDLAAALTNVGPTAAAFGFNIEELNNALAILSTRGIAGAEAGTALKSMLTNIMRPTDKVQDALRELNVTLYDQQGTMLSLPEIIGQFERAMAGLTDEQKNQYIQTLAGTYGMKTMQTLLAEGTEGWYAMADATSQAASIQDYAAAKASTLSGVMEGFEGVMETILITVGEAFLPMLTEWGQSAAAFAEQNGPKLAAFAQDVAQWLGKAVPDAISLGVEAWNTISPVLEAVFNVGQKVVGVLKALGPEVVAVAAGFLGFVKVVKTVSAGTGTLSTLMGAFSPQILAVGAAVAALVAVYAKWNDVQNKVAEGQKKVSGTIDTWGDKADEMLSSGKSMSDVMSLLAQKSNDASAAFNKQGVLGNVVADMFVDQKGIMRETAMEAYNIAIANAEASGSYQDLKDAVDQWNASVTDSAAQIDLMTEAEFNNRLATESLWESMSSFMSEAVNYPETYNRMTQEAAQADAVMLRYAVTTNQASAASNNAAASAAALAESQRASVEAAQEAARAQGELMVQMSGLSEESFKAKMFQAIDPGEIGIEAYATLGQELGVLDEKAANLATAYQPMVDAINAGIVPADQAANALTTLYEQAGTAEFNVGALIQTYSAMPGSIDPGTAAADKFNSKVKDLNTQLLQITGKIWRIDVVTEYSTIGTPPGGGRSGGNRDDLPQFQTGAWNIPRKMAAILDPGEMVLPRYLADLVRAGLSQPPGGDTFNYTLNYTGNRYDNGQGDAASQMREIELFSRLRR